MEQPIVEFDEKRKTVDLTCREWPNVSDQFVTMTYDEFELWLLAMLQEVRNRKNKEVKKSEQDSDTRMEDERQNIQG